MSYTGSGTQQTKFADSPQLDAFGRLRVGDSNVILDCQFDNNNELLLWVNDTANGGARNHDLDIAGVLLTVDSQTNSLSRTRTRRYWRYRAGHSMRIVMTFVIGTASAGVVKELGYFDDNNGIIFRQNASGGLELVIRTDTSGSPVETIVAQADWNVDTLGAGDLNPSGVTLDVTKTQLWWTDFQWLGVGRVRCGFSFDGTDYVVHEFNHANNLGVPYMGTGTLPLQYRIFNETGSNAGTLIQHCSAIYWEGGKEGPGYRTSVDMGTTAYTATTTLTSILAIRLKDTNLRDTIQMVGMSLLNTGINPVRMVTLYNPTVTGSFTWGDVSSNHSTQVATDNLAVTDEGFRLATTYVADTTFAANVPENFTLIETYLGLGTDYSDASDIFVLAVETTTGTSAVLGTMSYQENR